VKQKMHTIKPSSSWRVSQVVFVLATGMSRDQLITECETLMTLLHKTSFTAKPRKCHLISLLQRQTKSLAHYVTWNLVNCCTTVRKMAF